MSDEHTQAPPPGPGSKGKLLVALFLGLVLTAISAFVALIGLESGPIGNAFVPGGTTPENLPEPDGEGARLLVRHCGSCHNLPTPKLHTAETWPYVLERMLAHARSQVFNKRPIPTEEGQRILLDYLQRNARDAQPAPAAQTGP
jgi:hypothetical protein